MARIATLTALLLAAASSHARAETRLFFSVGADAYLSPTTGGHGYLLAGLRVPDALAHGRFSAAFNTDTLELALDDVPLVDGVLEVGTRLRGEAVFAGLLPDYFRRGVLDEERGFNAHFVSLEGYIKWLAGERHSLALALTGRQWFFGRSAATAEALVLPAEAFVVEPRLHYTFWRLTSGGEEWHGQRVFPRIRGVAAGLDVGFDWRTQARPWGARDATFFDPVDPRNDPGRLIWVGRQWLRAGWQVSPTLRWQLAEWAAWGRGEDDLTRVRIGGHNPYVVPLSGQPWAAFLSDRFVAAQTSLHWRVVGDTEVGMLWDGVLLSDLGRGGRSATFLFTHGVAALADVRVGSWQIDARIGYSFAETWRLDEPAFGVFVAVGTQF